MRVGDKVIVNKRSKWYPELLRQTGVVLQDGGCTVRVRWKDGVKEHMRGRITIIGVKEYLKLCG